MKKSLYIRICIMAPGLLFLLLPYFCSATSLAGTSLHKADFGLLNPSDPTVSGFSYTGKLHKQLDATPDTSLITFVSSSNYTLTNFLNRKSKPNFITGKALAAPPTIVCPGNITANTDPGICRASVNGLAATINDTDGDITTLTWTMVGATTAASPISGINNIAGPYNFNKGATTVTYRVTDAGGSTVTCSFTVTINDKEVPTMVCPENAIIAIPSCASVTDPITFSLLSVSDNCGILNFNSNAPLQFPIGNTPVLWTANDISGNSSQCIQIVTVTSDPPVIVTIINQTNVACTGSATGSVTVAGSGGTSPYEYNINGGPFQASGVFNNLSAGTYTIVIKDINNCTSSVSVIITQAATELTASITSQTNVLCNGQTNGSATVTANGGTAPYIYSWNTVPVQTAATAINLSVRNYTVTVTDATGCIKTANVTITQPTPLVVNISSTNVACSGDSTGTATALASGGTPPYTYAWLTAPIQTTATVSNLPAGTYTVAVFDSSGCFKPAFVTITQPATKITASVTNLVNVACAGSNTGSITVAGIGGIAPIQYSLNGGTFQSSGTFNSLTGGTYIIVVRDANNCVVNLSATITEPANPLTALITSQTNVLCNGQANGSATVTANGGTAPYIYSWNTVPVQTTATAINLSERNYTVTITDAAGCITTANVSITQPTALVVTITKTDISCFGDSTGTATALASGGTPPYTYAWLTAPIQTTATVSNLPEGTYTVAVFDSSGCFKPAFVTITQPATQLTASVTNLVNVACAGSNTGSITVTGNGGIAPIQYSLDGGTFQASGTFSSLAGGTYAITVRDANNCVVNLQATITEPANPLTAAITSQTNVLCNGQANGSATVTANGGTAPYIYSWNTLPVQTTTSAINLTERNYTVTVTDAAGCTTTANVSITQPTALVVTITKTDISCFGDSTGTATVLASGGIPPYTFAWLTTPIQTTATASNLPEGTYTVAVFDSSGCFKPAFVTITQPATKLIASITDQVNVACTGNNTGSLTIAGSGGIPPYQYSLNGGTLQASGTFNSLAAGAYTIAVMDANNCAVDVPAIITEPADALNAVIASQNVLCAGQATGSATVTASGGTSPYTFSWNTVPVQTTETAINLASGNYTVTITDAGGCTIPADVTITQPSPIDVIITGTDIACSGESTGTATAQASGGTPPYTYAWMTTPVQTTATILNLPAGTYTVAVFDSAGCFKPAFVTITEPASKLTASITDQVNVACGGNTGSLTVTGNGGIPPYQYNINGSTFQASGSFINLSAGNYTVTAMDANNCTFDITATITEPADALRASITALTNVLCFGEAKGSATVTATGGSAPYSYSWNTVPIQTTATITDLVASSYIVTTTDNTGCIVTDTAFITQPSEAVSVAITSQVNYDCATGTNGSVIVEGTGGTPGYQFSLDGGPFQVSGTFTNLAVGNYVITVQDASNCTGTVPVEITLSGLILAEDDNFTTQEDTPLNGNVMANDRVVCNLPITVTANMAPQNGIVVVNADGTFTYTSSLNYNGTDSFTYTITDNSGGTSTATVFITIEPVNDPPVTFNSSITVIYNMPTSDNVLVYGQFDPDGTALTVDTTPLINPGNGTFVIAGDGNYTYTPDLNYSGNDTVVLSICDAGIPLPSACTNDTIFIVVLPDNLPPVTVNENVGVCQGGSFTGTSTNGGTVFNGESDPENNLPLTLNSIPVQGAFYGVFIITDAITGTFNYTPNSAFSGTDYAIVNICDSGIPNACSNDTIFIDVHAQAVVNAGADTTLCVGNTFTINQAGALNFSTLLWTVSPVSAGTIINPETLNPTFTPAAGFAGTATLTLSAKGNGTCSDVEVSDGMDIIIHRTLIADAGIDQTILPGTATVLSGSVTGGSGFYAWNWQPASLLLNPSDEDPFTVQLNSETTFALMVLDIITGCTDNDSVTILTDNSGGSIVAVTDHDTTLVNSSVTFSVLDNDLNPDNDPLTISICGYPSHGLVIINSDNTITYTPYSDYRGDDEFCYRICSDINPLICSSTQVFINVKPPSLTDLFAFKGISPNGDGNNDVWKIRGIEKYPDNTVLIFNRWGDKLREFTNYNNTSNSWDGKNEKGNLVPDGTYFYILDVKNVGVLKGWIFIRGKE